MMTGPSEKHAGWPGELRPCFFAPDTGQNETLKMYKNSVELIAFVGKDAEIKQSSSNNSTFTVLSVATKESWKNKETGEWESRAEWHQVLVAGKAGQYAARLKKGAHVQIDGTLRSMSAII